MHICRESNGVADFLAAYLLQHEHGMQVLLSPSLDIKQILHKDSCESK